MRKTFLKASPSGSGCRGLKASLSRFGLRGLLACLLCCSIVAALTGCSDSDDTPAPFDHQLLWGFWYAEVPLTGETENWRTEEVGDMTTYDLVKVLIYFYDEFPDFSYWNYFYTKDGDFVNFAGVDRVNRESNFNFDVTPDGHIFPDSYVANAPRVESMHYVDGKIYAVVNGMETVFAKLTDEQSASLEEYWFMLVEAGMVGYDDGGYIIDTDVSGTDADEPSRSRMSPSPGVNATGLQ